MKKLKPPIWLYVNADGVLMDSGGLNQISLKVLVDRRRRGYKMILWSSIGKRHAAAIARRCKIGYLFEAYEAKPDCLDNDDPMWIRRHP